MSYQLGAEYNLEGRTGQIIVRNTKNAYVGFRAFARAKNGCYREVFGVSSNTEWVDGCDQGGYFHHTHETQAEAIKLASKAYRWLNK